MKKQKVNWEGRKRFFKDGNPEVYKNFNSRVWNMMTEYERAMWTPFSEADLAPISKEVIEFEEQEVLPQKEYTRGPEKKYVPPMRDDDIAVEDEREKIKQKLKDLDIKFSHNSKLETLQKKLEDATNQE